MLGSRPEALQLKWRVLTIDIENDHWRQGIDAKMIKIAIIHPDRTLDLPVGLLEKQKRTICDRNAILCAGSYKKVRPPCSDMTFRL